MERLNTVFEKNYLRENFRIKSDLPLALSCKFKHIWDKHVTFTCVRPYIEGQHTLTICDHINIQKSQLEKYYDINKLVKNRKYYLICYTKEYKYNSNRMGIQLAENFLCNPILDCLQFQNNANLIINSCYKFSSTDYYRK